MKRLVVILVLAAAAAHADTKIDRARAHFKAAEAHFDAGRWDQAAGEYQAAYALAPRPLLLFNVGSAYRRKSETTHAPDDLRAAIAYYKKYLDAEPNGKAAGDAREFLAGLEKELVAVEPPPPAERPPAPPEPEPEPAPAPPAAAVEPPVAPPPAPATDSKQTLRIAGLVTGGVGIALVATGAYFGLQAKSKNDDLAGLKPGDTWDPSKYDAAHDDQRNFILFTALGGAAIAGGAVMTFVLGRAPDVAPAVTAHTVGVAGRF